MSVTLCDTPTRSAEGVGVAMANGNRDDASLNVMNNGIKEEEESENGSGNHAKRLILSPTDLRPAIKSEPPEDINDTPTASFCPLDTNQIKAERDEKHDPLGMSDDSRSMSSISFSTLPQIRLTPTQKLMPTVNPVDPKRKFVCHYEGCTKSYGKSSHLRSHLTWHTGVKPFVCQEPGCGKGFTRSDELNRHVRTHTGEKPFECIQCSKTFSRSDHLTKHLGTHARQKQANATPGKKLKTVTKHDNGEDSNSGSRKTYMEMQAPEFNMNFQDGMHFMAAIIEKQQQEIFSPARVRTPEDLTDERRREDIKSLKIKLEKPQDSDQYQIIPTQLPSPVSHIKKEPTSFIPTEPQATPVIASVTSLKAELNDDDIMPEANVVAVDPNAVLKGSSMAAVDRPYGCQCCEKSFRRQDDLNRHMRTHTGEKPYACDICDRRFMRSDHLKKHKRTHTRKVHEGGQQMAKVAIKKEESETSWQQILDYQRPVSGIGGD